MAEFRRERQRDYLFPMHKADDPAYWQTENAYFIGEDAGESATRTTPSLPAEKPWYQSALETIVPAAAQIYQQRELTKLNAARLQQGLPMLTADQYARTYQPPSAQVQFGVTDNTKKLLMYGALGVLGVVALKAAKVI